jgi:hypothetical protein
MPQVIETTVYQLTELDDGAKQKARDWYREHGVFDDWHDVVYEDFEMVCAILGVSLRTRDVPLYGGGTRLKPCVYFSGFWSQGDGACFEATYAYAKQAGRRIRQHAPTDVELHQIADALQKAQGRNFYQLRASGTHRGHYYDEGCMAIAVERYSPTSRDMTPAAEDAVIEALRDLARWLYRQLEQEYEHQTSDEAVDEAIIANEYSFTAAGRRFG